jgi:hypothetical protein
VASDRFEPGRAELPDETTVRQLASGVDQHPTAEMPEVDTGTGWPDGGLKTDVRPAITDERRFADDERTDRRFRGSGCLFWLAGAVALIVVIALGAKVTGLWPHFSNPFGAKQTDRSQPTLLLRIQDLARFEAASGNFQEVIDVQKDRSYIPDVIFNDRTLFICVGSVDAYVDFTKIGQGAVTDSADHKSVTVKLPAPQLDKPNVDHAKSYVFATQQGLVNRIGDMFGNNPNKEQELYRLGEQRITQAARDSALADRAATNTRQMLTQLLQSLGYTTITVTFAAA